MEKKIRQLLRYLQIEYVAVWVLPLLLVALYETGVMTEGAYAGDVRMDYVCLLYTSPSPRDCS